MAHHKTTDQPGSDNLQPNGSQTRNVNARDTGKNRPNGEQMMTNANKTRQDSEDAPDLTDMSKDDLAEERGGHGHSGHSGNRNGSRKRQ